MRTAQLGFWWHSLGGPAPARAPLRGPPEARRRDRRAPATRGCGAPTTSSAPRRSCRSSCSSASVAGYGASGRNGGWVSGFFAGPRSATSSARAAGRCRRCSARCSRPSRRSGRSCTSTTCDADYLKSGQLGVAIGTRPGRAPARARTRRPRARGLGEEDLRELSRDELDERLHVAGRPRRDLHPARRARAPGEALAGAGRRRRVARGDDLRAHARATRSAQHAALTPAGSGARAAGWCARPRATPPRCGPAPARSRRSTAR